MLKYLFLISCNLISFQNLLSSNLLIKSFMSTPRTHSHDLQACNFIKKETLVQVFSCDFCEIFKNTFFYRTPLVAATCDMAQH